MILLIVIQFALTVLYFATANVDMSNTLWIVLMINLTTLGYLTLQYKNKDFIFTPKVKIARLIFTVTLLIMEILEILVPHPLNADGVLGLINDSEVFVTGILIGALWSKELLRTFNLK